MCDKYGIPYVEVNSMEEVMPELDVLYMTRVQKERFLDQDEYDRVKDCFILTPDKLRDAKPEMRILHPLPRVNEISVDVDTDPRAAYFRQVRNGKYVRMALILKLLEWAQLKDAENAPKLVPDDVVRNRHVCSNPKCISNVENVDACFRPDLANPGSYRCLYCESKPK